MRDRVRGSAEIISYHLGSLQCTLESQFTAAEPQIKNSIIRTDCGEDERLVKALAQNQSAVFLEELAPVQKIELVIE